MLWNGNRSPTAAAIRVHNNTLEKKISALSCCHTAVLDPTGVPVTGDPPVSLK